MKKIALLCAALFMGVGAYAQETLTLEDAVSGQWSKFRPTSLVMPQWAGEEGQYSHLVDRYKTLQVDKSGREVMRVTTEEINTALEAHEASIRGMWIMHWADGQTLYFESGNSLFTYNVSSKALANLGAHNSNAANMKISTASLARAYTVDNNVSITWADGTTEDVTNHTSDQIVSGQAIARSEFGITEGLFWNASGDALAFYQKDESLVADYPLLDVNTTPGTLRSIKYPMAGQGSEYASVGVWRKGMDAPVYLDTEGDERDQYLTNLSWSPDGKHITLAILNRDQNHFDVVLFDAHTGERLKTIYSEEDPRWAEPEHPAYWINNTDFVAMSERDGFMNLYLYNIGKGFLRQLTDNDFVAKSILGRNERGEIYFTATGADARENHLYKVALNGKQKQLTEDAGTHRVTVCNGTNYFIDNYSALDVPGETRLNNGRRYQTLIDAEDPLADYNVSMPELGSITGPDGTELYTRMFKPFDFDPAKKYPVLVYVYGGPHAQMITNSYLGGAQLWMAEMANRGYIVFTLDNRGSANRGTAFEKGIHRQLGTLEMEDQLAGVEYLKSLPYVDGDRMAVHGWSYGGYMTTSLMLRSSGTFKVGVAGGPVTDWSYYEVMYGERYMDRPSENQSGYDSTRLANHVDHLDGDLLLIHGTVDPVVVMQHNFSLVQAFVEAGVQVDFFPYPMHEHNVRGKDRVHLMTKILAYIEDNL